MEQILCPQCGAQATSDDFVCPNCELILNEAAAEAEPVSVVQALLSPTNSPSDTNLRPLVPAGMQGATVRMTVVMDEFTVPRLLVGVDLALKPLHPFEAYVASYVDGSLSVPEIAAQAEIADV